MRNIVISVVVGAVNFAVLVWLVRSEGEKFRQTVRDTTQDSARQVVQAAGEVTEKVVSQVGGELRETIEVAGNAASRTLETAQDVIRPKSESTAPPVAPRTASSTAATAKPTATPTNSEGEDRAAADLPKPQQEKVPPAVPTPTAAPTPISTPTAVGEKREAKKPPDDSPPAEPVESLFKVGQSITRSLDQLGQEVLGLDEREEIRYGAEVHQMILKDGKIWRNPTVLHRVQVLAAPLLEFCERKNLGFTFTLLDDPAVNAMSILGGYVYLSRGLIEVGLSDAELQLVIGHEIAHVDLKHCVGKLTYAVRANEVAGDPARVVIQAAYQLAALGYSEEQEFECDAWSYQNLGKLNRSHEDRLAFLVRMSRLEKKAAGSRDASPQDHSIRNNVARQLDDHFASHPPTAERIKRLEALK